MEYLPLIKLLLDLLNMALRPTRDMPAEERAMFMLIREAHEVLARQKYGK